jgi:hypothetical protein
MCLFGERIPMSRNILPGISFGAIVKVPYSRILILLEKSDIRSRPVAGKLQT